MKLKHLVSGAVVKVPNEKAKSLGSAWATVSTPKPKAPAKTEDK